MEKIVNQDNLSTRLQGCRALLLENNPPQLRAWINLLTSYGVQTDIVSSISDYLSKALSGGYQLVILNQNLLSKSPQKLLNDFKQISALNNKLIIYPKYPKLTASFQQLAYRVIDWPLNDSQQKRFIDQLVIDISSNNYDLISESSIVNLLKPYLIFSSPIMKQGLALLPRIARTPYNVLITGQTGTGKEMVARAIHSLSNVSQNKFVAVNCAAIPESLVESELFGHEKGAFTGALKSREGKFQLAEKGTLFLDEIGDMPLNLQVKLLRAIEEKKITPIGSDRSYDITVRIITATQVDLQSAVNQGKFREDLFYRLSILTVNLPPLKDRIQDIPLLANHFLKAVAQEIFWPEDLPVFSSEALLLLQSYSWPGNVRQLKNFVTGLLAILPLGTKVISADMISANLDLNISTKAADASASDMAVNEHDLPGIYIPWGVTMNRAKELLVQHALKKTNYNKTKAAKILGLSVRHLRRLTKK